jgi:Rrf2 family protein
MFQVPAKTQYAIRALAHIARTGGDSAARVALAQNISIKYLEGILNQLKLSGIVVSDRGRQGGYRLSRPASEILMIEVVAAMEGELKPVECVDDSSVCSRGAFCMPRRFWQGLRDSVENYLKSVTLDDLAEEPTVRINRINQSVRNPLKTVRLR